MDEERVQHRKDLDARQQQVEQLQSALEALRLQTSELQSELDRRKKEVRFRADVSCQTEAAAMSAAVDLAVQTTPSAAGPVGWRSEGQRAAAMLSPVAAASPANVSRSHRLAPTVLPPPRTSPMGRATTQQENFHEQQQQHQQQQQQPEYPQRQRQSPVALAQLFHDLDPLDDSAAESGSEAPSDDDGKPPALSLHNLSVDPPVSSYGQLGLDAAYAELEDDAVSQQTESGRHRVRATVRRAESQQLAPPRYGPPARPLQLWDLVQELERSHPREGSAEQRFPAARGHDRGGDLMNDPLREGLAMSLLLNRRDT